MSIGLTTLLKFRQMNLRCRAVFVALADSDRGKLNAFYQALFGQKPSVEIPQVYIEFQLPGLRLGIFNPKEAHRDEFISPSSGGMSLCLEVEDLEEAIAHVARLGYPPPGQIQQASHGREIYAFDPCGNRLILHELRTDVLG
jgi:predicted enzyme related to lactoylglutathione lyase